MNRLNASPLFVAALTAAGCGAAATPHAEPTAPSTESLEEAGPPTPRPLRCDALPESVVTYGIGAADGELTELVPEGDSESDSMEPSYSVLHEIDLNGDGLPDYLEEPVEMVDIESREYERVCNNVGECHTRLLVGCDDDRVALVWGGDEGEVRLADAGRELAGLLFRDSLITQRLGGMAGEEAMERGEEPVVTFRLRIDETFAYQRVGHTDGAADAAPPEAALVPGDGDEEAFVSIQAAWGSGPNDIFAVGSGVLHYDGQAWWPMEVRLGERESMRSVWGSGPTDIYAIAGERLLHCDGQRWSAMQVPALPMKRVVWGSGPDDVYVVSGSGRALHYDGRSFSTVEIPVEDVRAMSGSGPDDVFVVGAHGAVARYDGRGWRALEPPTSDDIVAVHTVGPQLTLAVTSFSAVLSWNGRRWREDRRVPRADDGSDHASAIWAADAQSVFVGGAQSFVFVRNRRGWRRTEPVPPAMGERFTVWGSSAEDVYALGNQSSIFRLDEGAWVRVHGEEPELQ